MLIALAVCRLLHYAAVMMAFGGSAFVAALVPARLARSLTRPMRTLAWITLPLVALTALLWLGLEAGSLGEDRSDALNPAVIGSVLFDTDFGGVWQRQLMLAALLASLLWKGADRPWIVAVLSGLLLADLGSIGHATIPTGVFGWLSRGNLALHLLAGGAWLGSLPLLLVVIRRLDDPQARPEAVLALHRFSNTGHVVVALVVATGVINTILVLGTWPVAPNSPYQMLLDAKIAVVAVMIGLAVINRYVLVPQLRAGTATLPQIKRNTMTILLLGWGALALVSLFGLLEPS
jgi:putative copper resistance protein D